MWNKRNSKENTRTAQETKGNQRKPLKKESKEKPKEIEGTKRSQ